MLYAFAFERIGVLLSDLYFVDPNPGSGQEGPEHGVRLELRVLERGELKGSIYSAQPITVGQPVWRADLLESTDGKAGSHDRTHYHPAFSGWNPSKRVFVKELSSDPIGWVGRQLSDLPAMLAETEIPQDVAGEHDAADLRAAVPEIQAAAQRLLSRVRAGELGQAPEGDPGESARKSWL
jgi:hypothetical protein